MVLFYTGVDGQKGNPGKQGHKGFPGIPGKDGNPGFPGFPGERGNKIKHRSSPILFNQHSLLITIFLHVISCNFAQVTLA